MSRCDREAGEHVLFGNAAVGLVVVPRNGSKIGEDGRGLVFHGVVVHASSVLCVLCQLIDLGVVHLAVQDSRLGVVTVGLRHDVLLAECFINRHHLKILDDLILQETWTLYSRVGSHLREHTEINQLTQYA